MKKIFIIFISSFLLFSCANDVANVNNQIENTKTEIKNNIENTTKINQVLNPEIIPVENISQNNNKPVTFISFNEAKAIALAAAGLAESDTYELSVQKDNENGIWYYDVEFFLQNTRKKYEYKINAWNWIIAEFEIGYNENNNSDNLNEIDDNNDVDND